MSKEKAKGCVRPYRGETDRETMRRFLDSVFKNSGYDTEYFLKELDLFEPERIAFRVALVHESPGGVVDGAVLGSQSLNVFPVVDMKAVKRRARLAVLLSMIEAVEAGILTQGVPNINVFPSRTALQLTKELQREGFIFSDWLYRSAFARQVRQKLM